MVMPSLARKLTIEENVFSGIERGWTYIIYVIRQFIIFLPCLRTGYQKGRRKQERIKKMRGQPARSTSTERNACLRMMSTKITWTENDQSIWKGIELMEDDLERIFQGVLGYNE